MEPLPAHNTGLGFCYFDDQEHYGVKDAQKWVPELKALGASWLTLSGSLDRAIPEPFIRALLEAHIEPIIQLPLKPIHPIDQESLATLCHSYAQWGAHYLVVFDRPNTRRMWALGEWGKLNLVNQFVEAFAPCAQTILAQGLTPVFTPLKQGGDYWDTSFLDASLKALQKNNWLKELVFGVYGFAGNRPIEWGAGGSPVWPASLPYHTPPASQDQNGFRAFEWYQDVLMAHLGTPRPLLMIAGGAVMGGATDPNFVPLTPVLHAEHNLEIADLMLKRKLPDYLLNISFWSLEAWQGLPITQELKQKIKAAPPPKVDKGSMPTRSTATSPKNGAKTLYHYVLLPTFEWGASDWHWHAAMDYVRAFQPTCGFSVDDACCAEYVTIVGNEQGIAPNVELELRAAGCKVERVCGQNGDETKQRLQEMAKDKKRFLMAKA